MVTSFVGLKLEICGIKKDETEEKRVRRDKRQRVEWVFLASISPNQTTFHVHELPLRSSPSQKSSHNAG